MAKAALIKPNPVPEPPYLALTLTKSEAEVLLLVCGEIVGSYKGPRGKTSSVYYALRDIGVVVSKDTEQPKGKIEFSYNGGEG